MLPGRSNSLAPGLIENEVDTFNLQGNYTDKSFVREILAWESFRDSGSPYLQTAPMRIEKNGEFFGLYLYIEYLRDMIEQVSKPIQERQEKRIASFKENLTEGIDYYREILLKSDSKFALSELEILQDQLNGISLEVAEVSA